MARTVWLWLVWLRRKARVASHGSVDGAAIDRIMKTAMSKWHIPGASVAVVQNDKVVYLKAYGVRDIATGERATPDTLFNIASMTKAFTATAMSASIVSGRVVATSIKPDPSSSG